MISRLRLILFLVAGAAMALPLAGQQPTGNIHGRIQDPSGAFLSGVHVAASPGGMQTTSGPRGRFRLGPLGPGPYTLTASKPGYQQESVMVNVATGATQEVITLQPASLRQTVNVSAPMATSRVAAVDTEITAPNVLDVVSAQTIRQLPNSNVADVLSRMPGITVDRDEGSAKYVQIRGTTPQLSNVTVDGVDLPAPETGVREIKLDVIPADLVGSVQVSKTLQADQNGDAIGGTVNLVTRTAPPRPEVSIFTTGGYTPIANGRYSDLGTFTAGDTFGSHQQWGMMFTGTANYNSRGIDDVEPVPDLNSNGGLWVDAADLRQYHYNRHHYGFGGSVDYRWSRESNVYLRYLYSDFYDNATETIYSLATNQVLDGVNNTNTPSASNSIRLPDYAIGSLILGGEHDMPNSNAWINWELAASRSRTLQPQFSSGADFSYNYPTSNCQFDAQTTTNPYLPQFTPACYTEAYNQSIYSLADWVDGSNGIAAKVNLTAKFDEAKDYGGGAGTVEWGAQMRSTHQFDNSWVVTYIPNVGIPMSLFETNYRNNNYYNGNYVAGPWSSYAMTKNYVMSHTNLFTITNDRSQDPANFDVDSRVTSAYAMNTYTFGNWTVYAGLRLEQTDVHTLSLNQTLANPTLTLPGSQIYLDFLPSASLTWHANDGSDIRFAYYEGIARPEPYYLTTAESVDYTTNPYTYTIGNPGLVPEHGQDLDLMFEHYFTSAGVVRIGYFYKYLSDPIISVQTRPTSGPYAGFLLDQPTNAGHAWVDGVEMDFNQQFTYLPSALSGLGIDANYTWSASRAHQVNPLTATNPGRSDNPALLRQTPVSWNLSPTYRLGGFFGAVGLSYNGASIHDYDYVNGAPGGLYGPFGDVYFYPHLEFDAQASMQLGGGVQLVFSGLNLNNEMFGFYEGSPQYDIQREYYQPTYSIGVRWNLFHE